MVGGEKLETNPNHIAKSGFSHGRTKVGKKKDRQRAWQRYHQRRGTRGPQILRKKVDPESDVLRTKNVISSRERKGGRR